VKALPASQHRQAELALLFIMRIAGDMTALSISVDDKLIWSKQLKLSIAM
jgi:hypothetical protein